MASNPLQTINSCILASSILSLAGSLFTIVSFYLFEESRRCGRRILLCMSLADLGTSVAWLITLAPTVQHPSETSIPCYIQGYGLQFCRLSSYLWSSCFAFHLYQILWKGNKTPEMYESRYHLIALGFPSFTVLYLIVEQISGSNLVGFSGRPWSVFPSVVVILQLTIIYRCWIRTFDHGHWAMDGAVIQLALYYVPVALAFVFNLVIYCFLLRRLQAIMSSRMERRIRIRIFLYLFVFLLTFTSSCLGRLIQAVDEDHRPQHVLLLLSSIFSPLLGALNALVYGLNTTLKQRYSALIGSNRPLVEKETQ